MGRVPEERQASVSTLGELVDVQALIGIDVAPDKALPRESQQRHGRGRIVDVEGARDILPIGAADIGEIVEQIVLSH